MQNTTEFLTLVVSKAPMVKSLDFRSADGHQTLPVSSCFGFTFGDNCSG
uniref:Uncharacterized protein n=1 Tax=Rhizophora mucronata TaxID=61149 RepID=A0A2P2INL0_RHIMU